MSPGQALALNRAQPAARHCTLRLPPEGVARSLPELDRPCADRFPGRSDRGWPGGADSRGGVHRPSFARSASADSRARNWAGEPGVALLKTCSVQSSSSMAAASGYGSSAATAPGTHVPMPARSETATLAKMLFLTFRVRIAIPLCLSEGPLQLCAPVVPVGSGPAPQIWLCSHPRRRAATTTVGTETTAPHRMLARPPWRAATVASPAPVLAHWTGAHVRRTLETNLAHGSPRRWTL